MNVINQNFCVECSQPYIKKNKKVRCDSCHQTFKDKIEEERLRIQNGILGQDYVVCPVCDSKHAELTINHIRGHGFKTVAEFKEKFGLSVVKCGRLRDGIKGEKNPGYQHGGKLSPFSHKFTKYQGLDPVEVTEKLRRDVLSRTEGMIENGNLSTKIEFFLKRGLTHEEAQQALSERQTTFSLDKCIQKFGEEEGVARWKKRQEKWLATLDAKSDEEKREINRKKLYKNGMSSNMERRLVELIRQFIPEIETQFFIRRKDSPHKYYAYDIRYGNRVIEVNGNFWHANPDRYSSDELITFPGQTPITASAVWERDENKQRLLNENGFELKIVWEDSLARKHIQETVEDCVRFLSGSSLDSTLDSFLIDDQ